MAFKDKKQTGIIKYKISETEFNDMNFEPCGNNDYLTAKLNILQKKYLEKNIKDINNSPKSLLFNQNSNKLTQLFGKYNFRINDNDVWILIYKDRKIAIRSSITEIKYDIEYDVDKRTEIFHDTTVGIYLENFFEELLKLYKSE